MRRHCGSGAPGEFSRIVDDERGVGLEVFEHSQAQFEAGAPDVVVRSRRNGAWRIFGFSEHIGEPCLVRVDQRDVVIECSRGKIAGEFFVGDGGG